MVRTRHAAPVLLLKPLGVFVNSVRVSKGMPNCLPNRRYNRIGRVGQPVVNPEPVPTSGHKATPSKVGEVPRRRRLRHIQAGVQVTHADLPVAQEREDPQPRRIGQRLEKRGKPEVSGHGLRI